MADDRGITYLEDGKVIYRASSLGRCPRQLVLSRQSYDPLPYPQPVLTAFSEGNAWEPAMIAHLRANNWAIKADQPTIEWEVLPGIVIRGHLDGVGWHIIKLPKQDRGLDFLDYQDQWQAKGAHRRSQKVGLEVKALSKDNYAGELKNFPAYEWQVSCYMHGTGLPFVMVLVDKANSNPESITYKFHYISEPLIPKATIIRRILDVEKHVRNETLPDCQPDNFFCPYTPYHDEKPEPELVEDETKIELIRKYNQYGMDIKVLDTERRYVKDLILKSFTENKPYTGGGFSWQVSKFDKKEYTVKAQTVIQLTVKVEK